MAAGSLSIGIWPYELTDEIMDFLRPAAELGLCGIEKGPGWSVWTVHSERMLLGAANVRRTTEPAVEVVLVGGHDCRSWIGELDRKIGLWAKDEGATCLRAFGRRGWVRILCKQGWVAVRESRGIIEYKRGLT
jgi:hypothetical protein